MVGKKLLGLCIAALLVSQMAAALNGDASADASGRIMRGVSNEQTNGVDCIGGPTGMDCAITPGARTTTAPVLPSTPDTGILIAPTPDVGIQVPVDFPPYEDPYAKCEITLSEKELAKEAKLQKEIDALNEQINALYEKINEKTGQMPQHYDQECMTRVDRDNLKKTCNLTDADMDKIDRIQAELNTLYAKLGEANDEKIWEEINKKNEELSSLFSMCTYEENPSYAYPSYEDIYAKCEIALSEKELKNEEKLQKEIDALYEQINALYEKINEKTGQMPQHYDQECMTQVDCDNMKERCNLTDADLDKMERIQAELNALYEKLGGTDDTKIWEEINQKEGELSGISTCAYGPRYLL